MIDGFKATILDKTKFEQNILNDNVVPLEGGKADFFTGEFVEFPKGGSVNSVDYKITNKEALVNGSLHRFYNSIIIGENQNYNDFSLSKLNRSVAILNTLLHLNCDNSLTNVEFGFNLQINSDPNDIVEYRLLLYNFEDHNEKSTFPTGELYKEFSRTDYRWKVYKKRNDKKPNENILRLEMKFLRKRQLTKLGIFAIEDLTVRENLEKMFEFYLNKFDNLMIVDDVSKIHITKEQRHELMQYTNISYWNGLKEQKVTRKIRDHRKASALKLIRELQLDYTKQYIREQIIAKFNLLINS